MVGILGESLIERLLIGSCSGGDAYKESLIKEWWWFFDNRSLVIVY